MCSHCETHTQYVWAMLYEPKKGGECINLIPLFRAISSSKYCKQNRLLLTETALEECPTTTRFREQRDTLSPIYIPKSIEIRFN